MFKSFFDIEFRLEELDKAGDPLTKLNEVVEWESFRKELESIREDDRKSNAGRKPFDAVVMFKILILQSLYNLGDDSIEYQIRDRISFMRFLGLSLGDRVPDAKTIWLYRELLGKAGLVDKMFAKFDGQLRVKGFTAKRGQIIDASIIPAPKQRNSRDENSRIKEGDVPEDWNAAKLRQKDTDAKWVKKNGHNYFGYKNHISIDAEHKFIRKYKVTDAAVHDSNVFEELLDKKNSCRDVYADSAYRSDEKLKMLDKKGYREHIQRKGCRHKPLTEWEKQGNHTRSKIRSRIEHIFGVQAQMAGRLIIRSIGRFRAEIKIGLRNLAYNMYRLGTLEAMT